MGYLKDDLNEIVRELKELVKTQELVLNDEVIFCEAIKLLRNKGYNVGFIN